MTDYQPLYEKLINKITVYLPERSVKRVEKAFLFSEKSHAGQVRLSGEPYILHPLEVAIILAELEQDAVTLSAALLHDTLEDCGVKEEEMIKYFGADITTLVQGVTKLGKIYFGSKEEEQAENLRKMFLAMAKDLRVVLIKLADRLHNMRTLKYLSPEKQIQISKETREIFSPLAHRLGMWSLKWELEDLAFYYLQYKDFQEIKKLVSSRREHREKYVETFLAQVRRLLKENDVDAVCTGRPKHFYSIFKKLKMQNLAYDELYDVLGIRIMVNNVKQCYEVLGIIHSVFKPINGRFKDYIAMPKSNMYQSLHTSVIGPEGKPVEIQIRTKEMHQIAEFGIAAHWRYKEGKIYTKFDGDFSWLRQIVDAGDEKTEPKAFLHNLKVDLFIDEVFVFTPKGDVQVLPRESTPVDFAYKIHTQIGHCCIGAKVNGHIVTLDYQFQNGDRGEILTSKRENPKLDWLNFVKTAHAKDKIKYWLRKQSSNQNIEHGKGDLEKALLLSGFVPKDILTDENIQAILHKYNVGKIEEIYLQIAHGEISSKSVVKFLGDLNLQITASMDAEVLKKFNTPRTLENKKDGIKVLGEKNIVVHIAKCCNPLPGEDIIGFITVGFGVSIHRTDCANILHLEQKEQEKLIGVEWDVKENEQLYPVWLHIEAFDRIGLLKDIVNRITETKTNIREVKTKSVSHGGIMKADIMVDIKDIHHLNRLKTAISTVSDVYDIFRSKH